jgi:hypothetical protein
VQTDVVQSLEAWTLAVLLLPGVVSVILIALAGEWLVGTLRPLFSPRLYRGQPRLYSFVEPLYTFLKLLGRQGAVRWQRPDDRPMAPAHPGESTLAVIGALAPLLALTLLPLRFSPLARDFDGVGDLVTVLLLLAVQPVTWAVLQLREGGTSGVRGAQDIGRLLTGLLPTLLIVAALVEVSGTHTLRISGLLAAPETPQQTVVRLLAGVALLIALPWWIGGSRIQDHGQWSAAAYAGRFVQTVALAGFWTMLVLPAPGELAWAAFLAGVGTLAAYAAIRIISERWAPARRESQSATLVWATAVPAAVVALWTNT